MSRCYAEIAVLLELSVENFAVIERLQIALEPGFNVLTGETGAGKSLIVDAVGALLGSRLDQDVIRTGADQARVEGVAQIPEEAQQPISALLEEHGLEAAEDGMLVISRELQRGGRSVARVNGRAVSLSMLRDLGRRLVDIHGQSEHLSLLDPRRHADFLDAYGGLLALRSRAAAAVSEVRRLRRELAGLDVDERELERRRDLLEFQVREIEAANLLPGEDEALIQERDLLANAQSLREASEAAHEALYAAEGYSALEMIGRAQAALRGVADIDPQLQATLAAIDDAAISLEEAARSLRSYAASVEYNPRRLEQVEERLELIRRLKRKYGDTIEAINAFAEDARAQLADLVGGEERRSQIEAKLQAAEAEASRRCQELSSARREAARRLEASVTRELEDLAMGHVLFEIAISQEESADGLPLDDGRRYAFDSTGVDRIEFLVATNPGEPVKPLAKIASGGETSRLMLALKGAISRSDPTPTLIFDEIDVGIGGRSADVVGRKLWALSRRHQVLCVTHMPQIACYADAHYHVTKSEMLGRTFTQVQRLSEGEQARELAAMLGGLHPSSKITAGAQEMLSRAAEWKHRHSGGM